MTLSTERATSADSRGTSVLETIVVSAESTMVSSTTIEVADPDDARKVLRIIDALEDNDDVQDVFGNFDISEEIMEAVG